MLETLQPPQKILFGATGGITAAISVCHKLTSVYLPPPEVLTLNVFLISGNNQSHPPTPPQASWELPISAHRRIRLLTQKDTLAVTKYFPSRSSDIGLDAPPSLPPLA